MLTELDDSLVDPAVYVRRWTILAMLCLCLLVVMIANTSMNVALPILSRDLGASSSQLQWFVDSYSLVFAGLLFTAATLGDRFGRKGTLQAGLVVFALSAGLAATVVDTPGQLIATRAVMGIGGALVMPATLSILTNVFPRGERARAVGLWAGISGGGTAIGPVLTGFLLEHFSWHSVFAINIPFVAIAMVGVGRLVPRSRNPERTPVDVVGAVLSAIALTSVVYTLIEAPHNGWLSMETSIVAGGGLLVLALFAYWELRSDHPMLDVRLFRIRAFGVSSLVLTLVFFALMGSFFSIALLLQLVYGYSPMGAAVRLLPISAIMMTASPWSTRLVTRYGKRAVVTAGMASLAVGMALMATLSKDASYPHLLIAIAVAAGGMSLAMSPTTDLLMSAVPRSRAGMGSAMNDTTREFGGSLGVAVFGSLLASMYANELRPAIASLPVNSRDDATASLSGALGVAERAGGNSGTALAEAAREAWMRGFTVSMAIAAAIVAGAALLAWWALPDVAHDQEVVLDDENVNLGLPRVELAEL